MVVQFLILIQEHDELGFMRNAPWDIRVVSQMYVGVYLYVCSSWLIAYFAL